MRVPVRLSGVLLALLFLTLPALFHGSGHVLAQTPAPTGPGTEELVLSLMNYRLQQADLPAGFVLGSQLAITPSGDAFDQSNTLDEAHTALQSLRQIGLLAGFSQSIDPNQITPVREFAFQVQLFATNQQASGALRTLANLPPVRGEQIDFPTVPVSLGDESLALHRVVITSTSNNRFYEYVFWRRGRLLLMARLKVRDGTETLDQVLPLATSADRRAAAITTPLPVSARLPSYGSEDDRLDALFALANRLPDSGQQPSGFVPFSSGVISNADLVLNAPDPRAAYDQLVKWKRVAEVEVIFGTLQAESGDLIHARLALSADPAGAMANVLDPQHQPNSRVEVFALPAPLGDVSRLYHETYIASNGLPSEAWRLIWARGRVVLTLLLTGPAGDFTAQDAIALAAGVDDRYSRGSLPTILTVPLPVIPVPVPIT